MSQPSVESLKESGNKAVNEGRFQEAILHYTHAIKLDATNHVLYSNRSCAFLKVQQYGLALEDANETIRLNPNWPKGYFRKAEIEYAVKNHADAIKSYQKAIELKPDDEILIGALTKCRQELAQELKADEVIPWLGAGIGLIIGVIIVIADNVFAHKPTQPILMALVTISIAMVGYGIAKGYRYFIK